MTSYRFQRVQFEAPDHWIDASTIVLVSPDGPADHRPNVVIGRDEAPDAVEYAKEQIKKMRGQLKGYKLVVEENTNVGGTPAYFVEQIFTTPDNIVVRQQQLFAQDGELVIILSMSHVDSDFQNFRSQFEALRQSFRIA